MCSQFLYCPSLVEKYFHFIGEETSLERLSCWPAVTHTWEEGRGSEAVDLTFLPLLFVRLVDKIDVILDPTKFT